MRRRSITTRLVMTVGGSALVIIALLIGHLAYDLKKQAVHNREAELRAGLQGVAALVKVEFDKVMALSVTLAQAFIRERGEDWPAAIDRGALSGILAEALAHYPIQAMFAVWEPGGFVQTDLAGAKRPGDAARGRVAPYFSRVDGVVRSAPCPSWLDQEGDDLYARIRRSRQPCVAFVAGAAAEKRQGVVLFGVPVLVRDRFLGVIGGSLAVGHFRDLMASSFPSADKAILSLRFGDELVVSAGAGELGRTAAADNPGAVFWLWPWRDAMAGLFPTGDSVLAVPVAVPGTGMAFRLVLQAPGLGLAAVSSPLITRQIIVSLGLLVLLLGLTGYQAGRITRPLRMLTEAVKEVAAGSIDRPVAVLADDEIGELARHLNELHAVRKQKEEALLRAKREWEETFDAIDDAITIHDRQGRIIRANLAASQLLGVPVADIVGQQCHRLFHGADLPAANCPQLKAQSSRQAEHGEGFEPHLGRYLDIFCFPRRNQGEEVDGVVHVARDISQRKSQEEERHSLQQQMVQAQKLAAIGHLSGGIAHDFNNLLTPIVGYSELMKNQARDGRVDPEMVEMVYSAARKAAVLVQQLLAFSRKQVLEMRVVDLCELVREMLRMLRRTIGEHIALTEEFVAEPLPILADAGQIGQVIMNLALNASDAMPEGGRLLTCCDRGGPTGKSRPDEDSAGYARLSVRDTGCGMPAEIREKIFEPFFTTKGKAAGTGLGLSTVFGIVRQHRGMIEVDSEVGGGSEFRILFPLADEDCVATAGDAVPDLPGGREFILVVDDNRQVVRFVLDLLGPLGYRLLYAASGEEALEQIAGCPETIDLLLTDVVLPGINGCQLATALRGRLPSLKVLYMSGYTDEIISRHGFAGEAAGLLHKPLKSEELARKLRQLLDA